MATQDGDSGAKNFQRTAKDTLTNVKNFTSTSFTRAKQMTYERMGKVEATEFATDFNELCAELDRIKASTETILTYTLQMLEPNPALRLESAMYRKMGRQERAVTNPYVSLGSEMLEAGKSFGPETQYGGYMVRCGEVEYKIGHAMDRFRDNIKNEFVTPLRTFLSVDIRNALAERKSANLQRLDLDGAKSKQRNAKPDNMAAAEDELRRAQATFDAQVEKTKTTITRICRTHVNHLGHLRTLVSAQKALYKECLTHLSDVDADDDSGSVGTETTRRSLEKVDLDEFQFKGLTLSRRKARRAKLLYDYDAANEDEISVSAETFVSAYPIPGNADSYVVVIGEGVDKMGKVPAAYLELF